MSYLRLLIMQMVCPHPEWHREMFDSVIYQFEDPRVRGRKHCALCGAVRKIKI